MNLKEFCMEISQNGEKQLEEDDPKGLLIMCPEFSPNQNDIKRYTLQEKDRLYALCWNIQPNGQFSATCLPHSPSFFYSRSFQPPLKTQLHTHEYIELAYIVAGEFRQQILGREVLFRPGDLCLLDRNCLHQDCLTEKPAIVLFFSISNSIFEDIMCHHIATERIVTFLRSALMRQKNLQQYLHFKPRGQAAAQKMERTVHTLLQELSLYDQASYYICHGLLLRIFHFLSTEYHFYAFRNLKKEMNWFHFEEITSYMKEHLRDITVRRLAEHFHFQEDYFNRLLKSKTGFTYTAYLQNLRLSRAEELLKNTDLNIDQIAEAVGYHNKGYFYKIFTDRHNMTPAQFRKTVLP